MSSIADEEGARKEGDWINDTFAGVIMRHKHALPVMLAVYEEGVTSTSGLIRRIRGHPKAIIDSIRFLERAGILRRVRLPQGRHPFETRLTPRGVPLIETPIYRWHRLLRKWNVALDSDLTPSASEGKSYHVEPDRRAHLTSFRFPPNRSPRRASVWTASDSYTTTSVRDRMGSRMCCPI